MLPEPGVSWINLPSQRYQGPAQRSRGCRLSKQSPTLLGATRRVKVEPTPVKIGTSTKANAPRSTCQFYGQPEHAQQTVKVPHHGAMARELSLVQARGAKNCISRR